MINYEKKLRKENNQQEKQLTKENNGILIDAVVYLHSSDLCEYDIEVIRKELFGMAWEAQLRGENFSSVIGDDFKLFCDELIKVGRKKTQYEKVLEILYIAAYGIGAILIFQIITHVISNIVKKDINSFSFDMPITLGLVVMVISAWIAGYGIFYFVSKYSFELSKKISKKFKIIFGGIYLITFVVMTLSIILLRNIVLFSVNFVYIIIIILFASIIITVLNARHSKYLADTHK